MNDAPNPIQLQGYLGGVDYPATQDDLVAAAESNGADEEALEALRSLTDRSFDSPTDVTSAVADGN